MNIAFWIIQGFLAFAFFAAGVMKLTRSKEKILAMGDNMAWAEDFPPAIIRTIGLLEILGAIGLILPGLTGILPILTPIAAVGLVLTMIGAIIVHARRGENQAIIPNIVLLLLAVVVVYTRFVVLPLTA